MMKLAYRVFVVSLVCLSLAAAALAQTAVSVDKSKRSAKDDRNTAPTFGTGGPMGGPTGLFTVYDGQTLRRGEYTFSATYSNFDRDPGDVDIVEVPLNFQIGVTNNFELFFNTDGYRAVKVNSPGNLSSFYLPNSRLNGISGGALVLAPSGPGAGVLENRPVFRPAGTQPFVQFPFVGGSAGNFGFPVGFASGPLFGFPAGSIPTIGPATAGGAADNFPGLGSIYGSILPGIAFQTACSAGTPTGTSGCTLGGLRYPTVFTLAPSYLPDAPFINRTYGESAFGTFTAGGKIRFNDVNDWWGAALVAAYRWYGDSADDFAGFNQLQRGASPGGKWSRGDILVTGAFDGRFKPWWNIAVNVGYHWNASVKSDLFGNDVTILDRPDELLLSIGTDFPVNKYFQPIGEFRHTRYVGGRTPNAFENDPYEGLIGARVFPARWFGFSGGYRYHFNQQDRDSFDDEDSITNTAFVPCFVQTIPGGEGQVTCPAGGFRTFTTSYSGVPPGFRTSSDPHGFFFQAFIGRRNKRQAEVENRFADVTGLTLSDTEIRGGCPPGQQPREGQTCNESTSISVTTTAVDPENDVLTYNYTVSGGRIVGTGANVTWDLSGVAPGTYTITAGVDDGCGLCGKTQTQTVTVAACDCVEVCACPTTSISGPAGITNPGDTMTFTANVSGGTQTGAITYNWSVSNGTIESGQGTPSIVVRTTPQMAGQSVTATVDLGGLPNCGCPATLSETAGVAPRDEARLIDEFGRLPNDDIRGRLDTFFAELANNPGHRGYIINYGTPAQVTARERLIRSHITLRRVDPSIITLVNGGASPSGEPTTKLYRVPPGADNPTP